MQRPIQVSILGLVAVTALLAQAPKGWKMRVDRSASASDPDASGSIKFVTMGAGFHATNPQAAVYWNPANIASGSDYTIEGTFTLMKPSGHTNYYGLVFGGSDLDGPQQKYLYFTVAQDGTWLIKRRDGEAASTIAQQSSSAVRTPDASGKSINALAVRFRADKIDYVVNGTVVHSTPRTGATAKTDGIYGIRINHLLEVQIDRLTVSK